MLAWVSFPQQWAMTTWNKQTSTVLALKPVTRTSSEKLQTTKLNWLDSFCLKGLVGGIGIMLKFRLLRFPDIFLKPCLVKPKRGNLEVYIVYIYICHWLSRCGGFGIASVLQQLRATSTCCILSFSFIGETSVLEFPQPFFLVTVRPTTGQSQRSYSMLSLCFTRFSPLQSVSSKTKIGKKFSCILVLTYIKTIWQERKLTCDETTRPRTVRVHK